MYFILIALLLVFRIALFVYFVVTEGQYLALDSAGYINLATNLIDYQTFSSSLQPPLEIDFFRTPGYPFFLVLLKYLGCGSPYWIGFWQELLYCFSAWLFYHYSQPLFGKKIARVGLLFLLIEPGGFAYPKFILSETLFIPFVTLGLLFIGHYLKYKNWKYIVISAFIMGLGILVRPVLLYLPVVISFILIIFDFHSRQRWLHSMLLLLIITLTISPWLVRNLQSSGKIFISGQQSNLLANYHVPYVWELVKEIPFRKGQKIIANKVHAAIKKQEQTQDHLLTQIERYKVQQDVAVKELAKYPVEYTERWVIGVIKAILEVNLIKLNYVIKVPLNKVGAVEANIGVNFYNKVWDYLNGQSGLALVFLAFRGLIAIFSLLGAFAIYRSKDCFLWIIMLSNFYFIFSAGPVGSARFRLPIEVFWFIQAYYGFFWICSFWESQKKRIPIGK